MATTWLTFFAALPETRAQGVGSVQPPEGAYEFDLTDMSAGFKEGKASLGLSITLTWDDEESKAQTSTQFVYINGRGHTDKAVAMGQAKLKAFMESVEVTEDDMMSSAMKTFFETLDGLYDQGKGSEDLPEDWWADVFGECRGFCYFVPRLDLTPEEREQGYKSYSDLRFITEEQFNDVVSGAFKPDVTVKKIPPRNAPVGQPPAQSAPVPATPATPSTPESPADPPRAVGSRRRQATQEDPQVPFVAAPMVSTPVAQTTPAPDQGPLARARRRVRGA